MKIVLVTGAYRGLGYTCLPPRSVEEDAAGIVWLAADAPQEKTSLFWRDKKVIAW